MAQTFEEIDTTSNNVWEFLFRNGPDQSAVRWYKGSTCGEGRANCALDALKQVLHLDANASTETLRKMILDAKLKYFRADLMVPAKETREQLLRDFARLKRNEALTSEDLVMLCLYKFNVIPILINGAFQTEVHEGKTLTLATRELEAAIGGEENYNPGLSQLRGPTKSPTYIILWNKVTTVVEQGVRHTHSTWLTVQARAEGDDVNQTLFFENELPPNLFATFLKTQESAMSFLGANYPSPSPPLVRARSRSRGRSPQTPSRESFLDLLTT
jgi:hypothetical protein